MRYTIHGRQFGRHAKVSIGVPTYNGSSRVSGLLQSIRQAGGLARDTGLVTITLLDDGSTRPNELSNLVALADQNSANLLVHPTNEGITRSWNDLVRHVESDFCVLLNDDVLVAPNWLENLVYFLEQNSCGAAGLNTLFCSAEDVPNILSGASVVPRHPVTKVPQPERLEQDAEEGPSVVMCSIGCSFGFSRWAFDQLGGFDERTRQVYNESWFGTKAARDLKLPSYQIPAPRVWHIWQATFSDNPELHGSMANDRAAYEAEFGGNFDVTHPRYMVGTMPARVVKWLGPDGQPRERELTVQ